MRRGKWKEVRIFGSKNRSKIITPEMINKTIIVDTGKSSKSIKIKTSEVGLRLGELIHTKQTAFYKKGGG